MEVSALHLADRALPCWLGITPGQTTFEEAFQRMNMTYPGTVVTSINRDSVHASYETESSVGQITIQPNTDGTVRRITLIASFFRGLVLGDIVNLNGRPECTKRYPLEFTYQTSTTIANILTNSDADNSWRRSINNIVIRAADGVQECSL
jgi:hypothetical protein